MSPARDQLHTLRTPLDSAERTALDFFDEHLSPEWEIYVQPHLNGLRPDLVLLHPAIGVAVYEVKDWKLSTRDGHENPVEKIDRYKQEIYGLYCPRLEEKTGLGAITAGLIFPNSSDKQLREFLEPWRRASKHDRYPHLYPVVGRDSLAAGLGRVFPQAFTDMDRRRMSSHMADDLRSWLVEPQFAEAQRELPQLTRKQRELVETRTASGFRRIRGPAGSGKSLVLAGRAARLAAEGKDVLVVTFNITLLNYLMDIAVRFGGGKTRSQITWLNFHHWMKRAIRQAGGRESYDLFWASIHGGRHEAEDNGVVDQSSEKALLETRIPDLLDALLREKHNATPRYDAILVDEGQDFHLQWWDLLRRVLRPGGEMLLAADATQDLYGTASAWTEGAMSGAGFRGDWATLDVSHRLPPELAQIACSFVRTYLPAHAATLPTPTQTELAVEPCRLKWVQTSSQSTASACVDEAMDLLRGGDGAVADLTILTDSTAAGRDVVRHLGTRHIRAIHTFGANDTESRRRKLAFFMGDARVKVTTVHSFKGWESSSMVVIIERASDPRSLAGVYAAMTRLRRSARGSRLTAHSGHRDHVDRSMVIASTGHRDRSEATLAAGGLLLGLPLPAGWPL